MIKRRALIASATTTLFAPSISRGAPAAPLKFIPQSDLTILDPIVTTVYTARNHGFMVFDTLFGMNSQYRIEPQMLEGFSVEDDGKTWKLMLREGLLWHDGEKVLARDCVASIRRWAPRDGIGTLLMARTDELSATDDRTIRFRLKKPFALLPYALGKISTPMCAMMPERLAKTDSFKPLTDMVGSGPFRFKADEYLSGARAVYTNIHWPERRSPGDGLGHRDRSPRKQAAGGQRGLERVLLHRRRPGHADPGFAFPARHRRDGLVWLDQECPARRTARRLDRCARSGSAKESCRRNSTSVLDRRAASAAGCLVPANGMAEFHHRNSRWVPVVLGRAACVKPASRLTTPDGRCTLVLAQNHKQGSVHVRRIQSREYSRKNARLL